MGILRWEKRIGCSNGPLGESPTAALIIVERKSPASIEYCQMPYRLFIKQVGWRLRSRWKQYLIRRRRCNAGAGATLRYNYDLHSYAQNFDEGCQSVHDPRHRCAPPTRIPPVG